MTDNTQSGDSVIIDKGSKTHHENNNNKITVNSTLAMVGVLVTGIAGVLVGVYVGQGTRQPPIEVTRMVEVTRLAEVTRVMQAPAIKETVLVKETVPVPQTVIVKQTVEVPQTVVVIATSAPNTPGVASTPSGPAAPANLVYRDSGFVFTVRDARYTSKSKIKIILDVINEDSESKSPSGYVGRYDTYFVGQDGINYKNWVITVGSETRRNDTVEIATPKGIQRVFEIEFYELPSNITQITYFKLDTHTFSIKQAPEFRSIAVKPL